MWHTGSGRIIYDPKRPGLKKKVDWWCILTVDKEITRYYRWWIQRELHIGERPRNDLMHLWKKYNGQKIEFKYRHNPRVSGDTTGNDRPDHYWFIDVDCPLLLDIRKELQRPSDWNLHLTVGRTWF